MSRLSDNNKFIDNATTGFFRVTTANARLSCSTTGTFYAWTGAAWDAGLAFTTSPISLPGPGRYKVVLAGAGYASVQEVGNH